ncbi:MAG TPA: hypothetical protein VNS22_28185, partial [Geminicoccus sp.]|uniref:hypothetical protein n=1 Tax=Geminicoccus sp. TaxID=2024832 RepID=UPI002C0A744C
LGLCIALRLLAQAHPYPTARHADHAHQFAVMVRAGFPMGGIITVRGFCALIRAKRFEPARFMTGVCEVSGSRLLPGSTRTPCSRHSIPSGPLIVPALLPLIAGT